MTLRARYIIIILCFLSSVRKNLKGSLKNFYFLRGELIFAKENIDVKYCFGIFKALIFTFTIIKAYLLRI